jgi:hypothetical protein
MVYLNLTSTADCVTAKGSNYVKKNCSEIKKVLSFNFIVLMIIIDIILA